MTKTQPPLSSLPHHSLIAYRVALEFAECVGKMRVADARLREQARKSTIACVLNIAEGAGRRSRADKSRVYAIALGEGPARPGPKRAARLGRSDGVRQPLPSSSPKSSRARPRSKWRRRCAWPCVSKIS